jgi:CRP-like cAMP-binding protein
VTDDKTSAESSRRTGGAGNGDPLSGETDARLRRWLERWGVRQPDPSDAAEERWLSNVRPVQFSAGETLVQAGDRDDALFLLDSGLVRLFYTTADGRERNKAFYREGQMTGAVSAALSGGAAPFSIQCLEQTAALRCRFSELLAAAERNLAMATVFRELLADAFIRNEQREAILLTGNAEQRYRWLLQQEPELVGRVAQFHLASYLGIDAVSLSRLKTKINDRKSAGH